MDKKVEGTMTLEEQVDMLAIYILHEVDGEPSKNEGAIECAIRIMRESKSESQTLREWIGEDVLNEKSGFHEVALKEMMMKLSERMRQERFYITDSVSRVNATTGMWADDVAELEAQNAALLEALESVVMLIEDANKSSPNYRLKMCVAAETALPYLQEAIRKATRRLTCTLKENAMKQSDLIRKMEAYAFMTQNPDDEEVWGVPIAVVKKCVAQLEEENEACDILATQLATERDKYKAMLETLIENIDTLFDAYPEKMPLEDAMRHWQRCARDVLGESDETE